MTYVFFLAAWLLVAMAVGASGLRRAVVGNYRFPLLRGAVACQSTWIVAAKLEFDHPANRYDDVCQANILIASVLASLALWAWALYYRDRLRRSGFSAAPLAAPLRGIHPLTIGASFLLAFVLGTSPWVTQRFASPANASSSPLAPEADRAAVQLYETARSSVLTLEIFDDMGRRVGQGSGFLLDDAAVDEFRLRDYLTSPPGALPAASPTADKAPRHRRLAVTNAHVVQPATAATAYYVDGSQSSFVEVVEVLAEDETFDLALVVVETSSSSRPPGLPLAKHDPPVMQTLYAIGAPGGFADTIGCGHASGYKTFEGLRWLQTSCPLGPGSSGGPVLSVDGAVVGVTAKIHGDVQSLNLAATASTLRCFLERTNFAARRRVLPTGASLRWHEERERERLTAAAATFRTTDPASPAAVALAQLEAAYEQLREATSPPGTPFSYAALQEQAERTALDLPDDFRYLAYYVAGRCAAAQATDEARQRRSASGRILAVADSRLAPSHAAAATAHFERALHAPHDAALPLAAAVRHHLDCGHWNLAIGLAEQLIECLPRSGEPLWLRAEGHLGAERWSEAIADMESAVEQNPAEAWFHYRLGQMYATSGRWYEAIGAYELAMTLGAESKFDPRAAGVGIARAYESLGNDRRALAEWRELRRWGFPRLYCEAWIAACEHRLAQGR